MHLPDTIIFKKNAIEFISEQITHMHEIESIELYKVIRGYRIDPEKLITEETKNELAEYERLRKKYGDI